MASHQKSRFLLFFSPITIWLLFFLVTFIVDKTTFKGDTADWSHQAASIFIPSILILAPLAVIIRIFSNNSIVRIWVIEASLLLFPFLLYFFGT